MTPSSLQPPPATALPPGKPWEVVSNPPPPCPPELDWLSGQRAHSLARLGTLGLPSTAEEDWRYTSLADYTQRWTACLAVPNAPTPELTQTGQSSDGAITLDLLDGLLQRPQVTLPPGLTLGSLRQLTPQWQERLLELLPKGDQPHPDKLVDLNTALLRDGVLIATAPGACPTAPVHVRVQGGAGFSQPRLLVDLAPDSQLTLIVEHTGAPGALINAVSQLWLGRGSQLNLVRVQALPDDGMLTETVRLELGEAAVATVTSLDFGAVFSRQSLSVVLAGSGAQATIAGLFLADGHRHIDNHTLLEHQAPRTISRESFRGIADQHGHGIFNGKIIVQPGGAGSQAALSNRNLLLTPTAVIHTKPELEIHVDDVRCSHGATTGQLDANALFYLRSRGLDAVTAHQVLTRAFLQEILAGVSPPGLRARLDAQLLGRLAGRETAA